jgi:hypothetical protein
MWSSPTDCSLSREPSLQLQQQYPYKTSQPATRGQVGSATSSNMDSHPRTVYGDRPTWLLEDTPEARTQRASLKLQLQADIENSRAAAHTPEGRERERRLNKILDDYDKEEAEQQLHPQHEHLIPSGSSTPRANGAANHNGTTISHMPSRDNMVAQATRSSTRWRRNFGPARSPSTSRTSATHTPLQTTPPMQRGEATQTAFGSAGRPFESSTLRTSTAHSSLQETPPISPRTDAIQTEPQPPEGSFGAIGDHLGSSSRNSTEASSPAPPGRCPFRFKGGAQGSKSWPNSMLRRTDATGSTSESATLSASAPVFTLPPRSILGSRAATPTPSPMQRQGSGSLSSTPSPANSNLFTPTSSPATSEAAQSSLHGSRGSLASPSSSNTAPGPWNAEASRGSANVTPGHSNAEGSTPSRPPRPTEDGQLPETDPCFRTAGNASSMSAAAHSNAAPLQLETNPYLSATGIDSLMLTRSPLTGRTTLFPRRPLLIRREAYIIPPLSDLRIQGSGSGNASPFNSSPSNSSSSTVSSVVDQRVSLTQENGGSQAQIQETLLSLPGNEQNWEQFQPIDLRAKIPLRVIPEDGYTIIEVGELYPHVISTPILRNKLNSNVLSEEGQKQAGAVAETAWCRPLAAGLTRSLIKERRWPKAIRQLRLMDLPEYQHVEDVEMRDTVPMPIEFPSSQLLHELQF